MVFIFSMKKLLQIFREKDEDLLLRKFRVLIREKDEMIERGDMPGYAHVVAQAELVARKIIEARIN